MGKKWRKLRGFICIVLSVIVVMGLVNHPFATETEQGAVEVVQQADEDTQSEAAEGIEQEQAAPDEEILPEDSPAAVQEEQITPDQGQPEIEGQEQAEMVPESVQKEETKPQEEEVLPENEAESDVMPAAAVGSTWIQTIWWEDGVKLASNAKPSHTTISNLKYDIYEQKAGEDGFSLLYTKSCNKFQQWSVALSNLETTSAFKIVPQAPEGYSVSYAGYLAMNDNVVPANQIQNVPIFTVALTYPAESPAEPTLQSIQITNPPNKVDYVEGQLFDKTGMSVVANYSDGSSQDVTSSVTITPSGALTAGTSKVTVSYQDGAGNTATAAQAISVAKKVVTQLELRSGPAKKDYESGDHLDRTGMQVIAKYNDDTEVDVTSECMITPDPLVTGLTEVTVSYGGKSVKVTGLTVTEKAANLVRIRVATPPKKVDYVAGQVFNKTGMVVMADYDNNNAVDVTDEVTISPSGALSAGMTEVSISYTDTNKQTAVTTQAISVAKKAVSELVVKKQPDKKVYQSGDILDRTGMQVIAKYNDGTETDVTDTCTIMPETLTAGVVEVTLSFGGKSAKITGLTVNEVPEPAVTGIRVDHAPAKTDYVEGQMFDPSGMTVKADYDDGNSVDITGEVEINPTQLTAGMTTVTISYTDAKGNPWTTSQNIRVEAKKVVSLQLDHAPNKTSYFEGDSFDKSGMAVKAKYNDDTVADVTADCTVSPAKLSKGDTFVTLTYGGKTLKVSGLTVKIPALVSITIDRAPSKVSYIEGQLFEKAGIKVTAHYENSSTRDVSDAITWNPTGALQTSNTSVEIGYTENSVAKTVSQKISVAARAVVSLEITNQPDVKSYIVGDVFDKTGLITVAHYNDGSTADVTSECTVAPEYLSKGDTKVVLSYGGKSIDVTGISVRDAALVSISIDKAPGKVSYITGQAFNPAGIKVTAHYENDTEKDVTDLITWNPAGPLEMGTASIEISYAEGENVKTADQAVSVAEKAVDSLTVTGQPDKKIYTDGEAFDKTGLTVRARYNDGTEAEVTAECVVSPAVLTEGLTEVSLSYGGKTAKVTGITVKASPLDHITIDKTPSKISYVEGQRFSTDGMKVTAHYVNGTAKDVTDSITWSPTGVLSTDVDHVEIRYTENGIEKTASQPVSVAEKAVETLQIVSQPDKKTYTDGEPFDKTGLSVIAHYNDGTTKNVTGDCTVTPETLSAGLTEVTLSYGGKSVRLTGLTVTEAKDPALDHISIDKEPDKVSYVAGQKFEPAGIQVTAHYEDSSTKDVTDSITWDPAGKLTAGTSFVEICYTEEGIQKTANQAISVAEKAVQSLEVTKEPENKTYTEGDSFDKTGMEITAHYNDGTTADVTADCVVTPTVLSKGDTEVNLSYGGKMISITGITVNVAALTSISIDTAPTKVSYIAGQTFDPAGMVVTAHYENGAVKDVSGSVTWSPDAGLTAGTATVTISYTEGDITKNAYQVISVAERAVDSLEIVSQPDRKNYIEGDSFDRTGMEVRAHYNDGSTADVTADCVVTPAVLSKGDTEVTLSYGGKSVQVTDITVKAAALVSITIDVPPTKTSYIEGQLFESAGMKVTAHYQNGRTKDITDAITFTPTGALGTESVSVKISYTEGNITKNAAQAISVAARAVVSLEILHEPDVKNYIEGDTFDRTGLSVAAHYNDGTVSDVTSECTAAPEHLAKGDTKVVLSYGGKSVEVTGISVREAALVSISIDKAPDKVSYIAGQSFNPTGIKVTAHYENGTDKDVTDLIIWDPAGPLDMGIVSVEISYAEGENVKTADQAVSVAEKAVDSLTVTGEPDKKIYTDGEAFDKTGLIVTARYNDGTESDVTADCVVSPSVLTEGLTEVSLSYGGKTVKVTGLTVKASPLDHIMIDKAPSKTSYVEGQIFNADGMKVTAHYANGKIRDVTDSITWSPAGALGTDADHVEISYTENGIVKTANQSVSVAAKAVESLQIANQPDKKTYTDGEAFDKTGLSVLAHYNDGSTADVTGACTVTPESLSAGLTEVTLSYGGKSVIVTGLTVTEAEAPALDYIRIDKEPDKVSYVAGQKFKPSGIQVTAQYEDGSTKDVTDSITWDPDGKLTTETNFIEIRYTEDGIQKTVNQTISVVEKAVSSLEIVSQPDNKTYIEGDTFDRTGMEVTAHYNDGNTADVTAECVITPAVLSKGDTKVVLSYGGKSIEVTGISVREAALVSIIIDKAPDKVSYIAGQSFNPAGIKVTAHYENGTEKDVTDLITWNPTGPMDMDTVSVEISYEEGKNVKTTDQAVSVAEKAVDSLTVTGEPDKKIYTDGEVFDKTGLTVTARYNDGTEAEVTDDCVVSPATLTKGLTEVSLAYGGKKVKVTGLTVKASPLDYITIDKAATKLSYVEGQKFNVDGMKVTAHYANGTSKDVTDSITWDPAGKLTAGITSVEISYTEEGVQTTANQTISVSEKAVDSLEIVSQPDNKTYIEGDSFDRTGMEVIAHYNDGSTADVSADCVITPAVLTKGDTEVTLSYGGKSIKVTGLTVKQAALESITIEKEPVKVSYVAGQKFDPTGIQVLAHYENGSTKDVTDKITWSPSGNLSTGTSTVEIKYTEALIIKTASQAISVAEKAVDSLEVTGYPDNTIYIEGAAFDKTGLVVTAHYNDGTTVDVTSDCVVSPTILSAGDTEVTLSYGGKTVKVAGITVNAAALTSITIDTAPTKVSYVSGQTFDPAGIAVTAHYENGAVKDVTDSIVWNPDGNLDIGTTAVEISYTEGGISKSTYQTISVSAKAVDSLEIVSQPEQKDYVEGDSFDKAGMEIKAHYNDGTTADVTADCVVTPAIFSKGDTEVTVSYGGKSVQVTGIVVKAAALSSITIDLPPTKLSYVAGQLFEPGGMKVTAHYENGKTKDVTEAIVYSPAGALSAGTDSITISYTEGLVVAKTFQAVSVAEKAVDYLAVLSQPTRTDYIDGEPFDMAGVKVEAHYNDGTKEEVTDKCIVTPSLLTAGDTEVILSYGGKSIKVTGLTVSPASLQSITIDKAPTAVSYIEGQPFNPAGIRVTAHYENGKSKDVSDLIAWEPTEPLMTGTASVEISYEENGIKMAVSQAISVAEKAVQFLELQGEPEKTNYIEGEEFIRSGITVIAHYNDGTQEDVTESCIATPQKLMAGDTQVTLSYGEQNIQVAGLTVDPAALVSISIDTVPEKVSYVEGQHFKPDGMIVTAHYENGTAKDVTASITWSPAGGLTAGQTEVVISYSENGINKTIIQTISVSEKAVESLEVTGLPDKTDYEDGDAFDTTGLIVTAHYNDGTTADVTAECIMVPETLSEGDTEVTIAYGGQTVKVSGLIVEASPLERIVIEKAPDKVSYVEGQVFDPAGMKVTAYYKNGTSRDVTDTITYEPSGELIADTTAIEISYTEGDIVKAVSLEISVAEKAVDYLEVQGKPNKTEYTEGDSFEQTGLIIIAHYNDGTTEEVTEKCVVTPSILEKNDTEVTLSYGGQSVKITGLTVKSREPQKKPEGDKPDKNDKDSSQEKKSDGTPSGKTGGSPSYSTWTVKTGDDAKLLLAVGGLMSALLIVVVIGIVMKKKRDRENKNHE